MSLETNIRHLLLPGCIYNASGPRCTDIKELLKLDKSESALVLSKSATLEKREGNPKPRYFDHDLGSINSMGLPNEGINYYLFFAPTIKNKPYFISVNGLTLQDTLKILNGIIRNKNVTGIEINLSCPNIIGKGQLAYDMTEMDTYLHTIFNTVEFSLHPTLLIGVKLPPYFDLHWYPMVTNILKKYPIHFITCINSLGNGLLVDSVSESVVIKPKGGMGGIGGKYIKPIGLSNVRNFYLEFEKQNLKIDVIGCGGIETGLDIFEYILCGAKAVQIGTQYYKEGTKCFERLAQELLQIMEEKNYQKLEDFRGKLKTL